MSVRGGDCGTLVEGNDAHLTLTTAGLAAVLCAVVERVDPGRIGDAALPYTVGVTIDEFAPKPVGLLVGEGDVRARGIGGCGRAGRAGDERRWR